MPRGPWLTDPPPQRLDVRASAGRGKLVMVHVWMTQSLKLAASEAAQVLSARNGGRHVSVSHVVRLAVKRLIQELHQEET